MQSDFYKVLLGQISDAIIVKTPEDRVIYWSQGAEDVFGYTSDEAVARLAGELIIPAARMEQESGILREVFAKELASYESTRRKKDGSLIYVDVSTKTIHNAEGRAELILSTSKDVTRLQVLRDEACGSQIWQPSRINARRYYHCQSERTDRLGERSAEKLFGYEHDELRGQLVEVLLSERFQGGHRHPRSTWIVGWLFVALGAEGHKTHLENPPHRGHAFRFETRPKAT